MLIFELFIAAWFFALGAVIGSFMNVVVWRSPRGETLLGRSRCPRCGAGIRAYDNIPVFGWLMLRGKCRDCQLPISPRYPIVEFVTGCLFLVLALAELSSGGANLPEAQRPSNYGLNLGLTGVIASHRGYDLFLIVWAHLFLLCMLFCWALMRVDGSKVPVRHITVAWILGLLLAFIRGRDLYADQVRDAALGFGLGAVFGLILGTIFWEESDPSHGNNYAGRVVSTLRRLTQFDAVFAGFTLIGLVLGWQSVLSITFLASLLRFASACTSSKLRGVPLLMDLLVATVIHICFWRQFWEIPWWPGVGSWLSNTAFATAAGIILLLAHRLERWRAAHAAAKLPQSSGKDS